jgi:hypothetical protein
MFDPLDYSDEIAVDSDGMLLAVSNDHASALLVFLSSLNIPYRASSGSDQTTTIHFGNVSRDQLLVALKRFAELANPVFNPPETHSQRLTKPVTQSG